MATEIKQKDIKLGTGSGEVLEAIYAACAAYDEMVVPVNFAQGTITGTDPIRVRLDNEIELESVFLQTYQRIPRGALGCRVMLIRNRGGQKFILPFTQFYQ